MLSKFKNRLLLASAACALACGGAGGVQNANAGAFLWVSAPNWSYSAAAASSPIGSIYFWSLSKTFSWAYAFSNDGAGDAAYAYAEAAAGYGGRGAVDVSGFADPYAGLGIDVGELDPSLTSGYPSTQPSTSPFTSTYAVSGSGITFTSVASSELNGSDAIQAFSYSGSTSESAVETALGVSGTSGNTSQGDVTKIGTFGFEMGLIPLDNLSSGPIGKTLPFTENLNTLNSNDSNVILIGEGSAPEPASIFIFVIGGLSLLILPRVRTRR